MFSSLGKLDKPPMASSTRKKGDQEERSEGCFRFVKRRGTTDASKTPEEDESIREKKGNLKHSEFLSNLERSIGVSEWEKMSLDEFTIQYFVEQSDSILAKEGLEILGKPNPTVA